MRHLDPNTPQRLYTDASTISGITLLASIYDPPLLWLISCLIHCLRIVAVGLITCGVFRGSVTIDNRLVTVLPYAASHSAGTVLHSECRYLSSSRIVYLSSGL
ncbi:hypothetical protein BDV37DRAFT_246239, partial [Aspergillus pseudonomiae]